MLTTDRRTDADPGFLRRLAGHLQNGRDSVSDPALVQRQSWSEHPLARASRGI